MNRILLSILCFILFTNTNYAQYTNIINANRPGDTETPYAVGRGVFQIENSILSNNLNRKNTNYKINTFSNDLDIHYGFLSERLEATLNHRFSTGEINNSNLSGTENLSIGLKYLIYEHVNKESPELKRSWKRRYGFKYNGLIPSIAIQAKYHTPLASNKFYNGGISSYSISIITQNNINRKVSLNNQLDYYNYNGSYAQMVYSVSSSFVVAKRWNPYLQFQFYGSKDSHYSTIGIGTPFLVNKNLAIAANYKTNIGEGISGHEIGINLAFRIDKHYDRWEYIDRKKDTQLEVIETPDKIIDNPKEPEIINKTEDDDIVEEVEKNTTIDDNQSLDEFLKEIAKEEEQKEKTKKEKNKKKVKKKKKKKKKKKEDTKINDEFILSY